MSEIIAHFSGMSVPAAFDPNNNGVSAVFSVSLLMP
jgi:hypothetical protein